MSTTTLAWPLCPLGYLVQQPSAPEMPKPMANAVSCPVPAHDALLDMPVGDARPRARPRRRRHGETGLQRRAGRSLFRRRGAGRACESNLARRRERPRRGGYDGRRGGLVIRGAAGGAVHAAPRCRRRPRDDTVVTVPQGAAEALAISEGASREARAGWHRAAAVAAGLLAIAAGRGCSADSDAQRSRSEGGGRFARHRQVAPVENRFDVRKRR